MLSLCFLIFFFASPHKSNSNCCTSCYDDSFIYPKMIPSIFALQKSTHMKTFLLSIVLSLFFYVSNAQLKFGIQMGVNTANVNQNMADVTNKAITGFSAGIGTKVKLGKKINFTPGFNYAVKGYQYNEAKNENGESYKTDGEQKINYLEFPLVFSYHISLKKNTISIGAGPAIAAALSGYYKETNTILGQTITVEEDLQFGMNNDQLKKIDWGAHLSLEFEMPQGFFARLYYTHGLNNLGNAGPSTYTNQNGMTIQKPQDEYFNRNAGIMVGYYFGRKK